MRAGRKAMPNRVVGFLGLSRIAQLSSMEKRARYTAETGYFQQWAVLITFNCLFLVLVTLVLWLC